MNVRTNNADTMTPPITSFYEALDSDAVMGTAHISVYFALCYQWQLNKGISPFEIKRDHIMKLAKINSRKTFHKCMRMLHDAGYIKYIPSYNPAISSMVCFK